jgi:hypothetical protein
MPIQLNEEGGGKILAVKVSGVLARADYAAFVPAFEQLVWRHGKARVLFDMNDFHGWEPGALWEEIKFEASHLAGIERLAMVGDQQWQEVMAVFSRPFVKATIRYFDQEDVAAARHWLAEP